MNAAHARAKHGKASLKPTVRLSINTFSVREPLDRKPPHGRRDSVSLRFHGDSSGSARTTGDYTVREAAAARQRTGTSQLA